MSMGFKMCIAFDLVLTKVTLHNRGTGKCNNNEDNYIYFIAFLIMDMYNSSQKEVSPSITQCYVHICICDI